MPIRADLTRHHGQVHGGILAIVADNARAWAAASLVGDLVTNNYGLHLLAAPAHGESLRGVGTVIRAGKRARSPTAPTSTPTAQDLRSSSRPRSPP
jgi:acyl-coenzyme A thioesterase PaaI-like protein